MANAYGNIGQNQYTNSQIMSQLHDSGWRSGAVVGGYGHEVSSEPVSFLPQDAGHFAQHEQQHAHLAQHGQQASPPYASYHAPVDGHPQYPSNKGGAVYPPGFDKAADFSQFSTNQGGSYSLAGQEKFEGEMRWGERRVVQERMLESGCEKITGVRDIYTREKIIEVPQIYTQEHVREVYKPEIIERIIEVPKTEIHERHTVGPPQVQYQEQIIEQHQQVVEERVIHVPKKVVQERLIEVPKVEYVERIEYDDYIEYREVPVDKIIEVPEIEYREREVEILVPQQYIQEYYVDRYTEVPVTQIQEVERIEKVPVHVPPGYAQHVASMQSMTMPQTQAGMMQMQSMKNMQSAASMMQSAQQFPTYGAYDPNKVSAVPKSMQEIKAAPPGSQFLVPKGTFRHDSKVAGSFANLGSMTTPPGGQLPPSSMGGCPTPPMPMGSVPGSLAAPPPYASVASMPGHWGGNPYSSAQMTPAY